MSRHLGSIWVRVVAGCILLGLGGCSDDTSSGSAPTSGGNTAPTASGNTLSCEQSTSSAAAGFEECFACMDASCCTQLQVCESDSSCVYCAGNPTDTACVDPNTFTYFANHQALLDCTIANCDLVCQGKVPSNCVPGDCDATCVNFANGCN